MGGNVSTSVPITQSNAQLFSIVPSGKDSPAKHVGGTLIMHAPLQHIASFSLPYRRRA